MTTSINVLRHGKDAVVCEKQSEFEGMGYAPGTWVYVQRRLVGNDYEKDAVIQLRDADGDNWLVARKGFGPAIFGEDLAHVQIEQETDKAMLIDRYSAPTDDGWKMVQTIGDRWLPKSQISIFRVDE